MEKFFEIYDAILKDERGLVSKLHYAVISHTDVRAFCYEVVKKMLSDQEKLERTSQEGGICPACEGDGWERGGGLAKGNHPCLRCRGTGKLNSRKE